MSNDNGTVEVISANGVHRDPMRQALMVEGFHVVFTADLSSAKELINETKPSILLHDFTVSEDSQSRQFQLGLSRVPFEWDMPRVIMVEKITPDVMALANDAQITKVLSRSSSVLAVATELGMTVVANAGLSDIQRDIRNMRLRPDGEVAQEEIDQKIEAAFETFAHDPEVKIEYANLELRRDELDKAQELAEDLISQGKQNVRAMNLLARVLMKKGEPDTAVKILEKADILSPNNCDRLIEMGGVFFAQGNLGKAKKCFKNALQIEPAREEAAKGLGQVHISEGDAAAAIDLFRGNLSEEESAGVFNNAAVNAVNAGDLEKGLMLYESAFKCLKTNKYKHKVLFNVALAQKKSGNLEEAHRTLKQVLEFDPSFMKAKRQLAAVEAELMEKPIDEDSEEKL
jgi:tetratricopeptide (TPR) repeat protein